MSANVSPMSSYVDTHLLECSRQSSVQVQSNANTSNALFMNKLNEGIQLNVGDKVSVHSSVISEVGAGGNTIEMKGSVIGNSTLTKITTVENKREPEDYNSPGYINVIERADAQEVTQSDKTLELRDNIVNMSIQYYKATNGENCFSLPRCYADANEWTYEDNGLYGATLQQQQNGHIVEDDYQRDRNSGSAWTNKWLTNRELLKVRQDGTKYTIFVRDGFTYFNASYTGANLSQVENGNGSTDPAVAPYVPYRELKSVTIPKGRRSADFIAETFTRALQNASNLDPYNYWKDQTNPSTSLVHDNQGLVAGIYKTDTYKPFTAATWDGFNKSNFLLLGSESQEVHNWINSFQYVAFKRPEFVEAGRSDFNEDISFGGPPHYITNVSSDSSADKEKMTIEFNASYTEANCSRINKFVKSQSLYPEFWDFRNASSPYNNRNSSSQITGTSVLSYIAGHIGPIDIISATPLLTEAPSDVVNRTITISNASIFPNPTTVTSSVLIGTNEYRVTLGGSIIHTIPMNASLTFDLVDTYPELTVDNSRFFHLDMVQTMESASKTLATNRTELGSDMYHRTNSGASQYNTPSSPLFVYYQDVDKDTFYVDPEYNGRDKKLTYGLFMKGPNGNIQVSTEGMGGVPESYYNASGFFIGGEEAVGNGSYTSGKFKRHFGYDVHFSAYGNAGIGLWSGIVQEDRAGNVQPLILNLTSDGSASTTGTYRGWSSIPQINKVYIGATEPQLTYDNIKDRFGFAEFYTPEFLGNKGGAGDDGEENPVRDGGAKVYKINKRLRNQNYAPGMGPYKVEDSFLVNKIDGNASVKLNLEAPNRNIYPFSFMDCHSGIAIESFGITEVLWNKSLMGILGFNYSQLQAILTSENTLQTRINTNNIGKLNKVTTQAEIKAVDTLLYNQNIFGAIMYHPNILISGRINEHAVGPPTKFHNLLTPLSIDTNSLTATADGVPRQMISPFYTIRSDILDEATYLGGDDSGIRLPVISHVLKSTDSGDFFTAMDSTVQFTITKPKVVTSITTCITDPDGTFSRVDDNSAIIYRVDKNGAFPTNVLQSILGKK